LIICSFPEEGSKRFKCVYSPCWGLDTVLRHLNTTN